MIPRAHLMEVEEVPEGNGWLTPQERDQQARLRIPKRLRDWRLGRWAAKRAVSRVLGVRPESIGVASAPDGAPEASVGAAAGPLISISHSGGRGLCAVAPPGVAVGCDLEAVEPRSAAFVADWLTEREQRLVASAGPDRDLVATVVWSAKESALKVLREGLRLPTRAVEIDLPEHGAAATPEGWRPLTAWVRTPGVSLRWKGWWRTDGARVVTVVADGDLGAPIELTRTIA